MIRADHDRETLCEAFAASMETAGDGRSCPAWEDLWSSAHGEMDRTGEDGILMHVGECASCAAAWRVARDLATDHAVGKRRRRFSLMHLAAAAILVVAVAGLGVVWLTPDDPAPVYRAMEGEWLQPEIPLDTPIARDDCLLRWTPGPVGSTYHVRVTGENLELLSVGRWLDEPEFLVPASALEELPPGSVLLWQVSARLPDGRNVDSGSFISRIE